MGDPDRGGEGPLIRVAEAISDGTPVDWQKETSEHGALRVKLGRLRLLEAVASAHRDAAGASAVGSSGSSPAAATSGAADPMARTGGDPVALPSRWGPLLILEKLDTGGFADVYRAHDPTLQREVALKLRHPGKTGNGSRSRDFLDEARRLARVRHPNVLVVHGADKHDGMVGLWTDLLEGKTLERCLTQQGPFSAHEAALVGIDLCGALAAVHAAGLVHRDVKTTNVMREKGGRIVLMDFGSASEVALANGAGNSRQRAGTPLAMAPEVLLHGEPPSRSADIYGLGVLLYRLVSARYPIEVQNLSELVEKHREGARVPLRDVRPDLPLSFVDIVERALDRDPTRRHPSAGAMEQALVASLDARKPDRPDPAPRRWPYRAAAAVMVLMLGFAIWALWPRPLIVETSLVRHASRHGAREILSSGARVGPGDRLGLEILVSEPMHAYVVNEDAQGETFVLFPAGLDLENPLPPRIRVQLPGRLAGIQQAWVVTSAGGSETILLVLSREPLPEIEEIIATLPLAEPGRPPVYPEIEPQALREAIRGIGGIAPSAPPSSAPGPGRLKDLARLLPQGSEVAEGVWIHRFELDNPGR